MSTRSITTVKSRWGKEGDYKRLATIYRHHDGYLEGHGQYLFNFLNGLTVVNGIRSTMPDRWVNGPGRLAGELIAQMNKDGHEPCLNTEGDCGQEYEYLIEVDFGLGDDNTITVSVFSGPITVFGAGGDECNDLMFKGSVQEYGLFLQQEKERSF